MKTGWDVCMGYRRGEPKPYIDKWEQPLMWWMVAGAYGLWVRLAYPIMKRVSKWHRKHFEASYEAKGEDYFYIPLTNRQDIRWDHLYNKHRTTLAMFYISLDDYNRYMGTPEEPAEPVAAVGATA